jgi:ribokinase
VGKPITAPARKVVPVDTTAAGDCFLGFFLAGLDRGDAPDRALATATVASSIKVTRRGAAEGIPTRAEVDALI